MEENAARQQSPILEDEDYYSKFQVHSKSEIVSILRGLQEQGAQITFYFNEGHDFLLTSLVDISADGDTLVFDHGSDLETNRRILASDPIDCVSSKEKVRIQFALDGVETISFEGRNAFSSRLPVTLVRLQRREDFRLATPLAKPILCAIPVPKGKGAHRNITATLVDISGGGFSLVIVPPDEIDLVADAEFPDVRFDLPKIGSVIATVRILYTDTVTLPSGKIQQRAGCQFVKLPGPMLNMIRRYIIQVERERKSREKPSRALA